MIIYPESSQQNGPFSELPAFYDENNSNRMTRFELDKAEDGTITILRETSGYTKAPSGIFGNGEKTTSFDNQTTYIVVPPTSKTIHITHRVEKMLPVFHHEFAAPDHHVIGNLARQILEYGSMDEKTATMLSSRIDMEIAACKKKRIGNVVGTAGGWKDAINRCSGSTDKPHSAAR